MYQKIILLLAFIAPALASKAQQTEQTFETSEQIIRSYVEDFRTDRFAADTTYFGITVKGIGSWTIHATGKALDQGWEVLMEVGAPKNPTFYYEVEYETLKAIHEGHINALTAQGKAFSSDYAPMDAKNMSGYTPSKAQDDKVNPFSFHFWTRGYPEIIPFGAGMTRRAHGSNFVIFYYEEGLRTAWYRILPGERVRDDAREQAAPFPMMGVTIKGTIEGEVDGQRITVPEGNTVFIPANVAHKWWNEQDEEVQVVLIMFGNGA